MPKKKEKKKKREINVIDVNAQYEAPKDCIKLKEVKVIERKK